MNTSKTKAKTQKKTARRGSLAGKAINIKGKKYVLVSDRVIFFNENFPNGSIKTDIVSQDDEHILIKATVVPDIDRPERVFVGHARELFGMGAINRTSAVENAETSAIGRALAMMGIGVIDSIASFEEVDRVTREGQGEQGDASTLVQKKAEISLLLRDLGLEITRGNVRMVVRELTGLSLVPENYEEIIEHLKRIKIERGAT